MNFFKEPDLLTKKLRNSVNYKDGKLTIYLADHRIVDENGVVIGRFENSHTLDSSLSAHGSELYYLSADDFVDIDDFKKKMKRVKEYFEDQEKLKEKDDK